MTSLATWQHEMNETPEELDTSLFPDADDPVEASEKASQTPEADVLRGLLSSAAVAGKKPQANDLLTPCINATIEAVAHTGGRLMYTEGDWWLYEPAKAYWRPVEGLLIEKAFHTLYKAFTALAPSQKFVADVVSGIKREVYREVAPWTGMKRNLLLFSNRKIVDLDTNQVIPPDPMLWLRHVDCLAAKWDPQAKCPTWDKVLDDVLQHVEVAQRQATKDLIEEWMGSTLIRHHKPRALSRSLFAISSRAHTGKSTLLYALSSVWGDERVTSASIKDLQGSFGLQSFLDKAVWACDETPDKNQFETESFKRLVTNEPIAINRKHQAPVMRRLGISTMIAGNHIPGMGDNPDAMHDRIIFLPMDTRVTEDPSIKDKLSVEIDGMAQRFWEACKRLRARGHFDIPTWMTDRSSDIRSDIDPFADFVDQAFDASPASQGSYVTLPDIWSAYRGYLAATIGREEARRANINPRFLGRRLGDLLPSSGKRSLNSGTTRVRTDVRFTQQPGLSWLDAGWQMEDLQYRTDQVRLAAANGTYGKVVQMGAQP